MQEIRYDGTLGEKKEGTIEELLEMSKESLEKKDVAAVFISKGEEDPDKKKVTLQIPGRRKGTTSLVVDDQRIRELVREELTIMLQQRDPLFKRILKEIQDGE